MYSILEENSEGEFFISDMDGICSCLLNFDHGNATNHRVSSPLTVSSNDFNRTSNNKRIFTIDLIYDLHGNLSLLI